MAIKVKKGKGILFEAVPDNGQIGVCVGENGRAQYVWPNRVVLPDDILTKLKKDTVPFLFPPPKSIEYQGASWIVNMCADADEYRNALIGLDQAFGDKLPIFNHPRAVAMTRRDLSAKLLEGIPNLIVPKCVRFKADAHNSFQKTFEAEGFSYPVLVRPATSQTGRDLVKIDTPFDWVQVYQTHWYGKYHYMTQFVDYSQKHARFSKIRVSVIGSDWSVRAYREEDDWMITGSVSDITKEISDKMISAISYYSSDAVFCDLVGEIMGRINLDFYGVDIGIGINGYVFFEANAAMTMAKPSSNALANNNLMSGIYSNIRRSLSLVLADKKMWADRMERSVESILNEQ